ncbi:MAG TPA: nicotinate-nucleotide adenylyltransferase [Roseiflexaceae bacterium]|nr:nicotinate-nucleotide adenylyltransferase [Roseiflexaceae bacterium]
MTARIGILGGTFDPIHYGHLAVAEEARIVLGFERILFVPAARQPLKRGEHCAAPQQRLEMTQLACYDNHAFEVSPIEIQRTGPSYTVDTLETLHAQGMVDLHFIVGADAAADLYRWRAAGRIVALARIVVIGRPGFALDRTALTHDLPGLEARLTLLEGPGLDVSSSELRRRVAAGQPIRYQTPEPVVQYIAQQRLYQPHG